MSSFESKFCKWESWDEVDTASLQFYVKEWTDYSKSLLTKAGFNPEEFDVFYFNSEDGVVSFISDSLQQELCLQAELNIVDTETKTTNHNNNINQYVILNKDGTFLFSPNHPSAYEGIVAGFDCSDNVYAENMKGTTENKHD